MVETKEYHRNYQTSKVGESWKGYNAFLDPHVSPELPSVEVEKARWYLRGAFFQQLFSEMGIYKKLKI